MNLVPLPIRRWLAAFAAMLTLTASSWSAVFPIGAADNARIEITDTTGGLSWNPSSITPTPNALTVACWVKLTIPSSEILTGDMTILV